MLVKLLRQFLSKIVKIVLFTLRIIDNFGEQCHPIIKRMSNLWFINWLEVKLLGTSFNFKN